MARLNKGQAGSQVGKHEVHLPAHHIGQALRGSFIGHVQDVDAGAVGQGGAGDDAGAVAAGIGDAARVLLGVGHQFADVLPRALGVHDQDEGQVAAARDRGEILDRVIGHVLHQPGRGRVRGVGGDKERVAVGLGTGHIAGRDGGVGARLVLDHDLLAQDGRQFGPEYPADRVGARAGREGHDQGDGLVGIVGGVGGGGGRHGRCADQRGA
ncbi:hypothetical protein D3C73_1076270 [compost metagenome]